MKKTSLVLTIAFTVLTSVTPEQVCEKDTCTGDTNNNESRIYPELLGLDQEDPALIKAIKERVLIPPPPKKTKLNLKSGMSWEKLKGQFGQVELIVNEGETMGIDPNKKGFFVEAGASDGEEYSNTLYLEQKLKWTGLLVEANPDFVQDLVKKKRRSWILPHCLSIKNTSSVEEFDNISFWGGIVNKQRFPGSSMPGDIDREGLRFPPFMNRRTLQVQCFPLYSVLMALGNPRVDYFSLDIEGAEMPVLRTIPWAKVDIRALDVEVAHVGKVFEGAKEDLHDFLTIQAGYDTFKFVGNDVFYAKQKNNLSLKADKS